MKTCFRIVPAVLLLLGALSGCARPKVVQGTVVAYDSAVHRLVVRDELPPNAELEFDVSGAEMNAKPAPGDLVRLAYEEEGGKRRATRVMGLAKPKGAKP